MSHFLFKPHVAGPEDNVTTPDVLIDRACMLTDGRRTPLPVHRLHALTELQAVDGLAVTPACALIACGGGTLLGLALVLQPPESPASAADCIVARSAWRLRNVAEHFDGLRLTMSAGERSVSAGLPPLGAPDTANGDHPLPRGTLELSAVQIATLEVTAPTRIVVEMTDPERARAISLSLALIPAAVDRWEARPLPRYTVGPVGEVKHYI